MPRKIVPFRNVSLFLWPKTFCVLRGWTIDGHFLRPTQCRFLRFEVPSMMQHWYEMPRRAVIRGSVSTFSPRYHCSLPITLVPMNPYELYWLLEEPAVCSACHGNHRKLLRPNILDWGKDFSWNSRSKELMEFETATIQFFLLWISVAKEGPKSRSVEIAQRCLRASCILHLLRKGRERIGTLSMQGTCTNKTCASNNLKICELLRWRWSLKNGLPFDASVVPHLAWEYFNM